MRITPRCCCLVSAWLLALATTRASEEAYRDLLPVYLRDRGTGMSTSLLGTYIQAGQWLIYPSYEFEKHSATEYRGSDIGFDGDIEYLGKSTDREVQVLIARGLTDDLVIEIEGNMHEEVVLSRADDDDTTGMPKRLRETGSGAVEAQIRWRVVNETEFVPEVFTHFEVGAPNNSRKVLLGSSDWNFEAGIGATKGFRWGTLTARATFEIDPDDGAVAFGEYAVEFTRRMSETWRIAAAIEGDESDLVAIGEVQWRLRRDAWVKLNLGFGLTADAPDLAPQLGVALAF